jgi:DNA-binding transcriptional regulator YhcF (GntR family)
MAPEENIKQIEQILLTLGPLEKTIFPLLKLGSVKDIGKEAKLPEAGVKRALQFLKNKGLVDLSSKKTKIIKLDINGILYLRKGLPERRLISLLVENAVIGLGDAKKSSLLN